MTKEKEFELVRAFVSGDEQAFNLIVRNYQERIYWHARRMLGNHIEADEVTQEVLITLYKKLKTFGFQSSLYTWIYKITSNHSLNQIRKNKLKKIIFLDETNPSQLTVNDDIIKNIEDREKVKKIESALTKIPPKQREVFILRQFEGMSYEEISKINGKSIGALKANYFHALKKIMEMTDEK